MPNALTRRPGLGLMFAYLGLALLVRGITLGNPVLGYDEQFYLLVGDRMWHGALPYVDIFDRKPIGLFLIFAAARLFGGDGVLAYQIIAIIFVALTAFGIARLARHFVGAGPSMTAGALYVVWLNLMECEGGQSPVFFNLLMVGAAHLVWRAYTAPRRVGAYGAGAMALVGLALQIKYTVVFEGIFFGCTLLLVSWEQRHEFGGRLGTGLIMRALLWVGCALAPTLMAWGYYAAHGQSDAFVFANFRSIFGRLPDPASAERAGLATITGIVLPLLIACAVGAYQRRGRAATPAYRFCVAWLSVASAGMLVMGAFLNPQYAAPVLVPLCLCAAPAFDAVRFRGRWALGLVGLVGVAGQIVLAISAANKGGRAEALALAAAATPPPGEQIYVYDGYPILYHLTHSALPTRWVFPGHLNTADEASVRALGVDPVAEEGRILATHPAVIVDDWPAYALGNPQTRALVQATLARNYRLRLSLATGAHRRRLVYWRRDLLPTK